MVKTSDDLLHPALDLISRHSPRLDVEETLQLLPPLVTAEELRIFLLEALREPVFDTKVLRSISKAHSEQVARKLMYLQSRRVKVTDSRMYELCCPPFRILLVTDFFIDALNATSGLDIVLLRSMLQGKLFSAVRSFRTVY